MRSETPSVGRTCREPLLHFPLDDLQPGVSKDLTERLVGPAVAVSSQSMRAEEWGHSAHLVMELSSSSNNLPAPSPSVSLQMFSFKMM